MPDASEPPSIESEASQAAPRFPWIGWSSLLIAGIQSVCSAFVALSSIRLLVGVGSVVLASSAFKFADRLHVDSIRIPMMLLALFGAVFNLIALWQVWRLRRRGASSWRQQAIPRRKIISERVQFALSIATLALLAVEQYFHWKLHS
jgi:hypothetical protein